MTTGKSPDNDLPPPVLDCRSGVHSLELHLLELHVVSFDALRGSGVSHGAATHRAKDRAHSALALPSAAGAGCRAVDDDAK
jgi:hypothetical protein